MEISRNKREQIFTGKLALICGGSKGIGKETAKEFVRQGGSVCILAREQLAIQDALREIEALRTSEDQLIKSITGDATQKDDIEPKIIDFVSENGVPDYLINSVGYAYPEYVQKYKFEDFKSNMEVNYYGQLIPTLILLPIFMREKKGHISFISSMLGYMGIIGYASYAPSKFALVGLAEVLRHELKSYNIRISILYPPDTDTPGFEIENQTKPKETEILSGTAKLFSPEKVAKNYLRGISKGKFYIMVGEGVWIWRIIRFVPGLFHMIIDGDLKKARRKIKKDLV